MVQFAASYYYTPGQGKSIKVIRNFLSWGEHANGFLATLSGFVLGYQYLDDYSNFKKSEFYIKRLARWPLVLAAVVLQGYANPVVAFGTWPRLKRAAITLACVQGWWNERYFMENIPLWACSVFAFLFLCTPLFLGFVNGLSKFERPTKFKILFGLWVLSFLLTYLMQATDPTYQMWGKSAPYMYIPAFLMGMLTAELFNTAPDYDVKATEVLAARFAGPVGGFLIFICYLFVPTGKFNLNREEIDNVLMMWAHFGMLQPLYCFTLYWLSGPKDLLAKFFSFKIIWVFGAIGPGIYLFFVPAYSFAERSEGHVAFATDIIFLGTIIIMAVVSYFILEVPFYKWALEMQRKEGLI